MMRLWEDGGLTWVMHYKEWRTQAGKSLIVLQSEQPNLVSQYSCNCYAKTKYTRTCRAKMKGNLVVSEPRLVRQAVCILTFEVVIRLAFKASRKTFFHAYMG